MTPMPRPLTSLTELEVALAHSFTRPILIFKHSSTCGVSAMASAEIAELLAGGPLRADVYLVHLQVHRRVQRHR